MSTATVENQLAQREQATRRQAHDRHIALLRKIVALPPGQGLSDSELDELVTLRAQLGFTGTVAADVEAVKNADTQRAAADVAESAYKAVQPNEAGLHAQLAQISLDRQTAEKTFGDAELAANVEIAGIWRARDAAKLARDNLNAHTYMYGPLLNYTHYERDLSLSDKTPASIRRRNDGDMGAAGLRSVLTGRAA